MNKTSKILIMLYMMLLVIGIASAQERPVDGDSNWGVDLNTHLDVSLNSSTGKLQNNIVKLGNLNLTDITLADFTNDRADLWQLINFTNAFSGRMEELWNLDNFTQAYDDKAEARYTIVNFTNDYDGRNERFSNKNFTVNYDARADRFLIENYTALEDSAFRVENGTALPFSAFTIGNGTALAVGGDLTGTVGNAQLGVNSVGSAEIANDAVTDAKVADALTITGGTIENSPIGGIAPASGNFTNLGVSGNLFVSSDLDISGNRLIIDSPGPTFSGSSSRQTVQADAIFSGFTGGYGAGVMGNAVSGTIGAGNSIIGGLIGKYNLADSSPSDHPQGAVIGEIGEDVGDTTLPDGAFIAVLGGDTEAVDAGAAYTVRYLNSTVGSQFNYGLDLFGAAIYSYLTVSYATADIRLQNSETISNATNGVIDMSGAAVLNRIATSSPTTDTTLTAAQSGTTFFIGTAGVDLTLPAIAGTSGVWYRFVVSAAVADTNQTVIAPTAILNGPIDVNSTLVLCTDEATIAFVQTADTAGDWVEVRSNGTKWFVTGQAQAVGGITCS